MLWCLDVSYFSPQPDLLRAFEDGWATPSSLVQWTLSLCFDKPLISEFLSKGGVLRDVGDLVIAFLFLLPEACLHVGKGRTQGLSRLTPRRHFCPEHKYLEKNTGLCGKYFCQMDPLVPPFSAEGILHSPTIFSQGASVFELHLIVSSVLGKLVPSFHFLYEEIGLELTLGIPSSQVPMNNRDCPV